MGEFACVGKKVILVREVATPLTRILQDGIEYCLIGLKSNRSVLRGTPIIRSPISVRLGLFRF